MKTSIKVGSLLAIVIVSVTYSFYHDGKIDLSGIKSIITGDELPSNAGKEALKEAFESYKVPLTIPPQNPERFNNSIHEKVTQSVIHPDDRPLFFVRSMSKGNKKYKRSFNKAKEILEHDIYFNQNKTFYALCPMEYKKNTKGKMDLQPNLALCPEFKHRKNAKANGTDWEHVQPASRFGQTRPCWIEAKKRGKMSRKFCADVDSVYAEYESDLHNLVPSIAEINRDRKNFPFGDIPGNNKIYGDIPFEIVFAGKDSKVEPQDEVKGDVARIALYMNSRYDINLSAKEIQMFKRWDELDPVSQWEVDKNAIVERIQGNRNKYVN